MKKRSDSRSDNSSDNSNQELTSLIGLGNLSTRKSYYPELVAKLDELEAEKNRYKWLFENAQHGIFQAQLDGGMLTANPAVVAICGYSGADHFCNAIDDLETQLFVSPDEYADFRYSLVQSGRVFAFETLFRRTDGECINVSINALLKQVEGGRPTIEAFIQDITERKKNQNRLKQLNEELEERVAGRTAELVTLNDKLVQEIAEREGIQQQLKEAKELAEQANQSKDKYLAAASHDLLQPMNAARLLIAALQERSLEQSDARLVDRVHLALKNAEELLSDLLDISKLDQNAVQPEFGDFRLNQLISALQAEFQLVAEDKGLHLRACHSSVLVRSDSRLLQRILRNFISNAIRYTEQGRVLIGCRRKPGSISIQIWDTGNGIPADKLQDVFKEFHQLDDHPGVARQGVGLGLAIVDRIARVLSHPLQVESVPGKGSMFAVEVPVIDAPQTAAPVQLFAMPVPDLLQGLTVLVIDNEENILVSMEALLGQWGCTVMTASSARQAVGRCQQTGLVPEVILADYHLDHEQLGTDAIIRVREHLGLEIPAVMLTADRSSECLQLFREQQFPVINKPVKPGKLRALLTHLAGE